MPKTPQPADVHVGNRIRRRRNEIKLSQDRLGQQIGVTFQQIQKYEKGTNRVGGSRLVQLAAALKVEVSYFFEGIQQQTGEIPPHDEKIARMLADKEVHEMLAAFCDLNRTQRGALVNLIKQWV